MEITLQLSDLLFAFVAIAGGSTALLVGGVSMTRARRADTILFVALHATVGVYLILHGLRYSGLMIVWPHLAWLALPLQAAAAPLFYILFRARLAGDRFVFAPLQLPHCLPATMAIAALLPVYFQSAAAKRLILQGQAPEAPLLWAVQVGLTPVLLVYFVMVLVPLRSLWKAKPRSQVGLVAGIFAADALLVIGFGAAGQLYDELYLRISTATLGFAIALSFLVRQWRPHFMEQLGEQATIAQYQYSRLTGIDLEGVERRIREVMVDRRLFLDEELSLPELARAAKLTPHQLSEFLNHRLGKNFYSFVNGYRVAEACRQLRENSDATVLEVAFASGFNSRTSFNVAFGKITGSTPIEYRRAAARGLSASPAGD
jgi:AraC-like DNA-binding protein